MERPALQRLLAEIRARRVDVVVVYTVGFLPPAIIRTIVEEGAAARRRSRATGRATRIMARPGRCTRILIAPLRQSPDTSPARPVLCDLVSGHQGR